MKSLRDVLRDLIASLPIAVLCLLAAAGFLVLSSLALDGLPR